MQSNLHASLQVSLTPNALPLHGECLCWACFEASVTLLGRISDELYLIFIEEVHEYSFLLRSRQNLNAL